MKVYDVYPALGFEVLVGWAQLVGFRCGPGSVGMSKLFLNAFAFMV